MAKLFSLVLVVAVVAVCTAGPARLRNFRQSRFSARQELEADVPSQTPYPPAGIKPDIPFDLPNEQQETEEPLETVEPQEPDNTYLPPDNLLPPAETYGPPDQFNGPPEASGDDQAPEEEQADEPQDDENQLAVVDPDSEDVADPQSERLVLARRARKQSMRPAKLRSAKLQVLPAPRLRSQRLVARPVYSTSGALIAYKVLRV